MRGSTAARVAGLATVGVLTFAVAGAADSNDESGTETVVAYFKDASPLDPGSQVRAAGVQVGTVSSIRLDRGLAKVTLSVERAVLPLHSDASMKLRPVNLLGENFVELKPGSPDAPLLDEQVVSARHTDSSVTLQDLLDTFDAPTSASLAALITTSGEGLKDSGSQAAAALRALAPAMAQSKQLGDVLTEQNEVLQQLIDRASPVAQSVSHDDGRTLDRLVGSTETTLSTLAANQKALDDTLTQLPDTLRNARKTLSELEGVADAATPTLKEIRPVTKNLDDISEELRDFSDAADPALASLEPVLAKADALLTQAAPVAEQLRAAGPDLEQTAAGVRPLGNTLLDDNLFDLMEFVRKWSLSTNGRDALSHYFRGVVHATPRTLRDLAGPVLGATAPTAATAHPQRAARGNSTDEQESPVARAEGLLGDLDETLNKTTEGLKKGLGGVPGGTKSGSDRATGLTPNQEKSLLGQLLGGN